MEKVLFINLWRRVWHDKRAQEKIPQESQTRRLVKSGAFSTSARISKAGSGRRGLVDMVDMGDANTLS